MAAAFALLVLALANLRLDSVGKHSLALEGAPRLPLPRFSLVGAASQAGLSKAQKGAIAESYGRLPLSFEENQGQSDPRVDFLARARGQAVFFTSSGATISLRGNDGQGAALRLALQGANPKAQASGLSLRRGKVNYLKSERSNWKRGISTYAQVRYRSIYPGIDLDWHGTNGGLLEYDFLLKPGANPERIALRLEGAERITLTRDGSLRIKTAAGTLTKRAPLAYQQRGGKRVKVRSRYRLEGNRVSIALSAYDRSRPLVIDPVLLYSTYVGGDTGAEGGFGIAVDSAGSAYITGSTSSADFPTTPGSFQDTDPDANSQDVFVSKLKPDGSDLVYSTYLGGTDFDFGRGIAVDDSGSAYVVGQTKSTDFPATSGSFQDTDPDANDYDAFVSKLGPDGSDLAYSTYLGGANEDQGRGIAVDDAGSAYVTSQTFSTDFPTTAGSFQDTDPDADLGDAFVSKLKPDGSGLVYSTYLGGDDNVDQGKGIAVDSAGSAYVTGPTLSTDFPTTSGSFQDTDPDANGQDAFVSKLKPDGSALAYSTYLGGDTGHESFFGGAIAIDDAGSAYATGSTSSTDFPTTPGSFQDADPDANSQDVFVSKLRPDGSALAYSSYLGGTDVDAGWAIAVDAAGSSYVTGEAKSTDFPTTSGSFQDTDPDANGIDAFVSQLEPGGAALAFSTYLGGDTSNDTGYGIAVNGGGSTYVTGQTLSSDFPTTPGSFQDSDPHASGDDAFVSRFGPDEGPPPDGDGDGPAGDGGGPSDGGEGTTEGEPGFEAEETAAEQAAPEEARHTGGSLPFTGVGLAALIVAGALLLSGGVLLRRPR